MTRESPASGPVKGSELCGICYNTLVPFQIRQKIRSVQVESYFSLEQRARRNCPICKLFLIAMPASTANESFHVKNNETLVRVYKDEHGDQGWQPSLRLEYEKVKIQESPSSVLGNAMDDAFDMNTRITVVVRFERSIEGAVDIIKLLLLFTG
jgi:hypothetical protein